MVILQFNKLIRNKWLWGAFAILISAAFCFDGCFTSRAMRQADGGDAGLLGDEPVQSSLFAAIVDDVRGIGRRHDSRDRAEINRLAWETCAALAVADRAGMVVSDAEVAEAIRGDRTFAVNGVFSFDRYRQLLREAYILPERYEESVRRQIKMMRVAGAMVGSSAWVSPMEVDRAVSDMTDEFTVRVARFSQTKEEAAAVKLDDAGLRKWYDANTNAIALPERVRLKMIKFDATRPEVKKAMTVTDDEVHDYYDATVDRYTSTDTNGVETVKPFEEVKAAVEDECRRVAAVNFFETNVNFRVYSKGSPKGGSRIDAIAAEDSLHVYTSGWFTVAGPYVDGFMRRIESVAPGAKNVAETVAELDPDNEDLRYGMLVSDSAVWLVEKAATSPAHVPTFDEAKAAIRSRALADARADAFKASVAALVAKGTNAVLSAKNVSTNLVFSICDLQYGGGFEDQNRIAAAARALAPGEISELVGGTGEGFVVVCIGRKEGDAAKASLLRSQIAADVATLQNRQLPESWRKWNLERIGFKPAPGASVTAEEDFEE